MSQRTKVYASLLLSLAALGAGLPRAHARQQQQQRTQQPAQQQQEEVLRISTDIVQTDVMVLDKEGRAVPGLAREQFELTVDGQPQPILFFDGVEAGGAKEAAKLAAARGGAASAPAPSALAGAPSGRSFIFFVDDLHLSQASVQRARQLLNSFIDRDMGPYDQAMIISPSGQVGFLQQLTDNKSVLRLAASRINYQPQAAPTGGPRSMTLAEARAIDRGQRDVFDYKVKEVMDDMGLNAKQYDLGQIAAGGETSLNNQPQTSATPGSRFEIRGDTTRAVMDSNTGGGNIATRRQQAEAYVRNEARRVLIQGSGVGTALLSSLETVARGSASLPGRKLVFFISDGFVIDTRGDTADRVLRVIDAAARSGVAIYTLDSQGLTANFADASRDAFADTADLTGGHDAATTATSVAVAEGRETKEVLRALAEDTGGRAILNRNDLSAGLRQVLGETASYYVLAWKPAEAEAGGKPRFRTIQVGVKGRPELRVLARKGFYTSPPPPVAEERAAAKGDKDKEKNDKAAAAEAKGMETEMRAALTAPFQRRQMGVASYAALAHEAPAGYKVMALADLSGYMVAGADGKQAGEVDFAAVLLDDKGKSVSSVGQRINAPSDEGGAKPFRITAKMPNALLPGLYQLRVAARDARTGRIGSSFQWIEVPEHKAGKMTLSSMIMAESASGDGAGATVEVERRFRRASHMLIQFLVYNAAKTPAGQTDVAVTLKVMQGGKLLISSPPQPLTGADPAKLEYSAGFPLANFPAGYYTLQIAVEDRAGKTTATQQLDFSVE